MLRLLFASIFLGLVWPAASQNAVNVPRYGKFEASFRLPDTTGNPFDPAVNDVQVTFHGPAGFLIRIPAFWDGEGVWKVRFAPPRVGAYRLTITRNGTLQQTQGLTTSRFMCVAGKRPGFVRVDAAHAQRFIFDTGSTYYPLGCNQAWTSGGLPDYPIMFAKMGANGMNWARVWMNAWDNKNLEWAPSKADSPPPGTLRLDAARRWDMIFDDAEKSGVYVQMCLQHHGQYTEQTDPNWRDNPFNIANGGFLAQPQDFFTDPRAIALTKNKYRYIVARWGYSDHLLAWELFNEVQNIGETRAHFDDVINWHRQMAAYLRQIDPNHHLITASNTPPGEALEKGVSFDYDQAHSYIPDVITLFATTDTTKLMRPLFWGEWGHSGGNWGNDSQSESFLHDGLWASTMTPLAGAAQFWYWDIVEKNNWWPQFKSVSRFLAASHAASPADLKRLNPLIRTAGRGSLTFAPPLGWGATRSYSVTVSPDDGSFTGLDGVSSSIQGKNHREMTREPIVFHLNFAHAGQFIINVGAIAKAGAHPELRLDGNMVLEKDYPASSADRRNSGEILALDVPAGRHDVSVWNTDKDWFTIDQITLTHYVPALAVIAKGSAHSVFFWAYAQTRPYPGAPPTQPLSGALRFSGLSSGTYALMLWNTATGEPFGPSRTLRATNGAVTVTVPRIQNDIAGWMQKK